VTTVVWHTSRPPASPRTAPIDWHSVGAADVDAIRALGNAKALQRFIGDVAMGDFAGGLRAREGGGDAPCNAPDPRAVHAMEVLQLQLQYLLYSHQALRERAALNDKVHVVCASPPSRCWSLDVLINPSSSRFVRARSA